MRVRRILIHELADNCHGLSCRDLVKLISVSSLIKTFYAEELGLFSKRAAREHVDELVEIALSGDVITHLVVAQCSVVLHGILLRQTLHKEDKALENLCRPSVFAVIVIVECGLVFEVHIRTSHYCFIVAGTRCYK